MTTEGKKTTVDRYTHCLVTHIAQVHKAKSLYLDVRLEVFPGDGVSNTLVNIVQGLLQDSGCYVLLLFIVIQHLQQHL